MGGEGSSWAGILTWVISLTGGAKALALDGTVLGLETAIIEEHELMLPPAT